MQSDELPLADVMDGTIIEQVFEEYEVDFGTEDEAVYTPAVTLWALVSQVFFASEQRSCKAAVIRVAMCDGRGPTAANRRSRSAAGRFYGDSR